MNEQEIFLERLTVRPTLACNFKCKLCNEFAPYYHPPKVSKLEEVTRDIDRVFSLVDRVSRMEISGGEPLLYTGLTGLLEHLYKYNDRFEFFSMVTNGSLIFSDEVLAALVDIGPKVRIIVDDYGHKLSINAQRCAEQLKEKGIRYELRDQFENVHADGWLDFRDMELKHDETEAKAIFARCVCPQKLHWVVTLHDGKLYPCHFARRCTELDIVPMAAPDCIDLYDPTVTDKELKEHICSLYTVDMLASCRYCSGFLEDRERFMPAEQIGETP